MTVLKIITGDTLTSVHFVHVLKQGNHAVDGGEDVGGVACLGNGVHVADGETYGGGGAVESC